MRRAAVILMLAVAGCAQVPRLPTPVDWPTRRAQLLSLDSWRMTGRVAVAVGDEGASASIDWRQSGGTSDISVSGPLGVGAMHALLTASGLRLEDSSGERLDDREARAALAERMGTDVPLAALRYWLLGVPDARLPADEQFGPDGHPSRFTQDGWQVVIGRYEATAAGELPTRLTIRREGATLKLAIHRWDLSP